jgi:hypothetical protein
MKNQTPTQAEFMNRRRMFIIAFGVVIAWFILVPLLPYFALSAYLLQYWWLLAFPAMLWLVFAHLRLLRWRCPRCEKPFVMRNFLVANVFARQCVHCGLSLADMQGYGAAGA